MISAKTRADVDARWAIWIEARDMTTGAAFPVGFWTGDDAERITVAGVPRDYYGAGAALSVEPMTYQMGAVVQTQRVSLGPLAPEVRMVLRGYDTRQAPVQVHLITLDPAGRVLTVEEAFVGVMDTFSINDGPIDDSGNMTVVCDAELVSDARLLTRTLSLKMSDASQRRRNASDGFRRYADVAGDVPVNWMGDVDNPHRAREKNNIRQ